MTVKAPRDGRWMYGLLLVVALAWPNMQAQPRYGTSIFIQAAQPTAGAYPGALWYDTTADALKIQKNDASWVAVAGAGGALPTGAIILIDSGACPAGTAEVAAADGRDVIGTLAANANVGTTLGSDTITPAGVNTLGAVSAHAGSAVADHASHTHTYTDVIAHTHTLPVGATDDTAAPFDRADAGTNAAGANASTASGSTGVATGTTAGPGAALTHNVTQPSAHTFTQPTFTGTQFDNRSAARRYILCKAT